MSKSNFRFVFIEVSRLQTNKTLKNMILGDSIQLTLNDSVSSEAIKRVKQVNFASFLLLSRKLSVWAVFTFKIIAFFQRFFFINFNEMTGGR